MEKLPKRNAYSARSPMWEHLWMKPEDDPEARIRELERPLAETARASEMGSNQPSGGYPYQPGTPVLPPPPPSSYGSPFPATLPRSPSRARLLWVLLPFFVFGVVALISYNTDRHSRGVVILSPTPSTPSISASGAAPAPSAGVTQAPAPAPSTSPSAAPTAPAGANLTISGIKENRTVACNGSVITISGISNKVVITGHCASLNVSGVQNSITVDASDTIEASGFNNQITYHTGSPSIENSGQQNIVQKG
jgi:hypothetical protein